MAVPASGAFRLHRQGVRTWCWNVAVGRPGNGTRREVGGGDPEALLPRDRDQNARRSLARVTTAAVLAAAAWLIAFVSWSIEPAGYDFVALYAAARLVATGAATSVTDADALLRMEHATLPERTILLNNPNPPALALLMAPLFALVALFERRRAIGLIATTLAVALVSLATVGFEGMARYPDLLTRIATELRPGELGLAALVRRVVGGEDLVLNAALAVVLYAIAAGGVFVCFLVFMTGAPDAPPPAILPAPPPLLPDRGVADSAGAPAPAAPGAAGPVVGG